ncbi:MAG: ABC transporter permease [bacterium]
MFSFPIVWEEWITWRNRFLLYLGIYMMSPLLFLITFGWGSGSREYLNFLLPGIMAFSALTNCYNGVVTRIVSSKTILGTMDFYLLAPVSRLNLICSYIISGSLRGFFAVVLILAVGFILKAKIIISLTFFAVLFLICMTFSALGLAVGFWAEDFQATHLISDVFVLPMSFLGGTFVALERLPDFLQYIAWLLPLTPGALLLRSLAFGEGLLGSCLILLLGWFSLFFVLAYFSLKRATRE